MQRDFSIIDSSDQLNLDQLNLDALVEQWLEAVFATNSRSAETCKGYRFIMQHYREMLHGCGFDLDVVEHYPPGLSDAQKTAYQRAVSQELRRLTSGWAMRGFRGAIVATGTTDYRLSTLSSFYEWAIENEYLMLNPIRRIKRPKVEHMLAAWPMEAQEVARHLKEIDCSTLIGLRDYTLLMLAFATGRRRGEIVGLRRGHIQMQQGTGKIRVTWVRCKGGKTLYDELDGKIADILRLYLEVVYQLWLSLCCKRIAVILRSPLSLAIKIALTSHIIKTMIVIEPELPVWISFTAGGAFQPLNAKALGLICGRHFGTRRFHMTRHTFAILMEDLGASLSEIAHRLGHVDLDQLVIYLARLRSDVNPYQKQIEEKIGLAEQHSWTQWITGEAPAAPLNPRTKQSKQHRPPLGPPARSVQEVKQLLVQAGYQIWTSSGPGYSTTVYIYKENRFTLGRMCDLQAVSEDRLLDLAKQCAAGLLVPPEGKEVRWHAD